MRYPLRVTMTLDFASDEDLLDRLSARPHELVYLVGSAVTAPSRSGEPGVPRVDGVIELIKAEYRRPSELQRLEAALAAEPDNRYQAAFRFLLRTRDQDVANAVIRRAVMLARRPSEKFPRLPDKLEDLELCRTLEDDVEGWFLPPAVEALGQVLARTPAEARPIVLTSNFDPLVSISVRRAGGRAYTTALHGDGSVVGVDGHGCLVVHFHGDWFRTDTLHTPVQLGQDRPKLSASLAHLVSARTLVVLGYSGWDDVFTRSLIATIRGGLAPLKVAWAFYPSDEAKIAKSSAKLLEALRPGIELGRVVLYRGIDAHAFLPKLSARFAELAAEAPVPRSRPGSASHPAASSSGTHASGSGSYTSGSGLHRVSDSGLHPASSSTIGLVSEVLGTDSAAACEPPEVLQGVALADDLLHRIVTPPVERKNPFQKAGMLGLEVATYVARPADAALGPAIEEHPLVVIRGDFSIGKSSLLLRADRYWRGGAQAAVCRLDLQMMRVDDVNLFLDEFFAEVGRVYGQLFKGWRELEKAAATRPLLLTLDEFAGLTPEVAQRFVPALYKVVTLASGAIRVVMTARDAIGDVLASFELANPNLGAGEWHEVELRPFSEVELDQLLAFLPPRSRAAVQTERATLREHSKMLPKPAQCLCFNLFKDEAAGASDAALAQRVRRKESYR